MAAVAVVAPLSKSEIATTSFLSSSTTLWILAILFVVAAIVLVAVLYVPSEKNVVTTKGIPSSLTLTQSPESVVVERMPVAVHENIKTQHNDLALAKVEPAKTSQSLQIVENAKHVQDLAPFENVVPTNPLLVREKPLVTRSRVSLEDVQVLADQMGVSVEDYLKMNPLHENLENASNQGHKMNRAASKVSNVDRMMAFSNTKNLHEVASLVRDINQTVPTSNDSLAVEVLRDILRAQEEAASLNVVLPAREASQTDLLKMYAVSKKQPMADLAKSILSRASA